MDNRTHSAAPSEELKVLSELDDRLCEVLADGDIRFVRVAWLLSQRTGYRIQRRQVLEQLEAKGESPSPLLSPKEAVELIRRCGRNAGAVTYGWNSPGAFNGSERSR